METWKILIVSLLAAVALGSFGGATIGKYLVKRARSSYKPLLTKKERIAYLLCILLGTASILFGVFYRFPDKQDVVPDDMPMAGEDHTGGEAVAGEADFSDSIAVAGKV